MLHPFSTQPRIFRCQDAGGKITHRQESAGRVDHHCHGIDRRRDGGDAGLETGADEGTEVRADHRGIAIGRTDDLDVGARQQGL